jgi:very-short-patch-repair endonuclease
MIILVPSKAYTIFHLGRSMPDSPVELALTRWRNNLIDLTRRNPLLALKPMRSAYLEIKQPDAAALFNAFVLHDKAWTFFLPPPRTSGSKGGEESNQPTLLSSAPLGGRGVSGEGANAPSASSSTQELLNSAAVMEPPRDGQASRLPYESTPRATDLVTHEADRQRLLQTLTNLHRRARADFRERGLHILHLACGILEWRDEENENFRSPLLLVPAALERKSLRDPFALRPTEDDPWLNPALAARLKLDFDFRLPLPPADWEEDSFAAYLKEVATAVAGLPGWQVKAEAVLAPFSFHKGVIYQDLQEHAERIKQHPLVQALAGVKGQLPRFDAPDETKLDEQDPRAVEHILDADASQRLSLEAAARGASFVLIGPPGTGKSQTIANLIADRIAHGQKVLFVSEKMAALEVVEQRLNRAGLGDCLLELHSHKANKRAVVAELARCWQERQQSAAPTVVDDAEQLRQRQRQLNNYVRALHQRREPIGKSAWDVLAEMPRWRELPAIALELPLIRPEREPVQGLVVAEVTPPKLDELRQMFQRAQSLWHIHGTSNYPWTGFKAERFTMQLRDEVTAALDKAQKTGAKVETAAAQVCGQLDIAASVGWLLRLGDLLAHRPSPAPRSWLLEEDLDDLDAEAEEAAAMYRRLREGRAPLTARYGAGLWSLPEDIAPRIENTWRHAAALLAPGDESGAKLLSLQKRLRGWAADTQKRLPSWQGDLRSLEKWLGLTLASGAGAATTVSASHDGFDPAPNTLKLFLRLTQLCHSENPPDRTWLDDPAKLAAAQQQILASRPDFTKYREGRKKLLTTYTDAFFDLELARIAEGYAGPYQSWFRVFNGRYRRDRRAITRRTHKHEAPSTVAEDVALGRDVMALKSKLETESPQRWQKLGRYERGLDTDVDAADKAARIAVEALDIARQLGHAALPAKLGEALCSGAPAEKIRAAVKRLQESFGSWWHETQELGQVLPMSLLSGGGAALEDSSLSTIVAVAKELQGRLNALAAVTDPLLHGAKQPSADMTSVVGDLWEARKLLDAEAQQQTEAELWRQLFGNFFTGADTDWEKLRRTLSWTRRLRDAWRHVSEDGEEAVPTETFLAVAAGEKPPPSFGELRSAHEQFRQALHNLEQRFDAPGPLLDGKPWREAPDELVLEQVATLRDRVGELADWLEWRQLPDRFWHLGLAKFWHALLQLDPPHPHPLSPEGERGERQPPLVEILQRAFWNRWLELVFQQDPELAGFRRDEHERVLTEFRALDRQLLQSAASRIPRCVVEQAGPADESEVALLMKEAHKKTKHLPLRRLFEALPKLLLQLKPCLLMSPLSVSQFLPADADQLQFDLIVFDEASQIVPEDAIAAIARGKQVLVTGDNRQLPPTMFFQQTAGEAEEDEEDPGLFESVLDACMGAGFPQQWLRWHYRSRHEHLIAFANERIYENRLVTFPGAIADHPEYGVQFRHVPDGKYDRGGRRDNPREAQVVADLVFDHLQRQPEKSLGVIAFSYAQMEAIEDELDRRLEGAPELEKHFQDDRLEGLFVKNLETVQGDERDVILLSVGYGPDEEGKITLNFGPLNRQGGERRLNVAVTRARQKLIVVSSIRARDIARATTKGIQFLQQYLDYAEHGITALRPAAPSSAATPALHALETDVRQVLTERGYTVVPQVGCASYRVDLGVADPKQPGRYLLGIEFDGPMYAQAAAARDRDRLRKEVLEKLGWKLHRVWALNWLLRRSEEVERLERVLNEATKDQAPI